MSAGSVSSNSTAGSANGSIQVPGATAAGLPVTLEDFDLNPSMDGLTEVLSQDGQVLDEDELMAELGGGSSALSAFEPLESVSGEVGSGGKSAAEPLSEAMEASEEASLEHALKALREENAKLLKVVVTAPTARERHEALRVISSNKDAIVELRSYRDVVKPKTSAMSRGMMRSENLALNRRDLPKFQLASAAVKAFPNEEVFESVDHYLRTFESILNSSSLDLEAQWAKLLPLCMPNGDRAWVDKTLLKCSSWWEAKQVFSRRFGSAVITRRNTDLVFTMVMSASESIMDYSCRFQQAVYNAGLQLDDPRVADRFMASLILPVQTAVRITLVREQGTESWTVDRITQVARDVLGDDNRFYAHATALLPGAAFEDRQERRGYQGSSRGMSSSGRRNHGGFKRVESSGGTKRYHCKQHGPNDSHGSKECQFLKFEKARSEGKCVKCWKPFERGHDCSTRRPPGVGPSNTALNHEVFAASVVTKDNESSSSLGASSSRDANADDANSVADQDQLMSELAFQCKLPSVNVNKAETNYFALLTPLLICVESKNIKVIGKVDTGSQISCISLKFLINVLKIKKVRKVDGYLKFLSKSVKRVAMTFPLKFKYANGIVFEHALEVVPFEQGLDFDVLLGVDVLPKMNIGLTGVAFRIDSEHQHSDATEHNERMFENINLDFEGKHLEADNSPAGTEEERQEFKTYMSEALKRNEEIPIESCCPLPEAIVKLPTKEGATAHRRPYPIAESLKPVVERQIQKWLDTKTIGRSRINSSFNSPLLVVPKRDKLGNVVDHRVCLDVRLLNSILPPPYNFPIPLVKDIFENLSGMKYFGTTDLKDAYHRFPIEKESQFKCSFSFNGQGYYFLKACFGLCQLPSQYQFTLSTLLAGLQQVRDESGRVVSTTQNFLDDIIIAGVDFEHYKVAVKTVIDRLTEAKLILQPSKCHFMQRKVRLLGFVVDEKGIRVDKSKCTNVANWPVPSTKKQVQQFMGLVNYLRSHIPMIYRVAAPITDLIKDNKNVMKHWTNQHTECFEAIKKILQADLLINYPDFDKEFIIACDASLYGVAAVIYQEDDKGRHKYVGFISSTLSPAQRRWSTTKRELYAIVLALRKFQTYIYGRAFRVLTDHRALVYLHSQKVVNPMMAGWIETILDFTFEVVHLPGAMNIFPDLLSRLYPPVENESTQLIVEESEERSRERHEQNRKNRGAKNMIKKKRYSKDQAVNIFATQVIENAKEDLDYMTPPEEERDEILQEIHMFGHYGAQAIVRELHSQGLHWANVYEDAKRLVSSCPECQKHNIAKRGWHPLKNVVSLQPMSHVSVDLGGPMTMTFDGYVYIMVVTDLCTKYVILRPLKSKEATSIARELIKVFGDYSFPIIMQSDHGGEFENHLLQAISENLGLQRNYSTPYAARGNGSAEASVKIVMNTLRKMCNSNAREWSDYLPIVQLCCNRYIKSKSMTSPFSLMFARRVTLPEDYANKDKYPIPKDIMSVKELEERIDYMHKVVFPAINEREAKMNAIMQKRFNDKHMLVDIPVGAHVMVKIRQRPSKLSPIYDGPYTVIRRNQGGSYELKDEMNEILHRNYVPSELKVVNIDEKAIDDEYFEIEAIRDHRGKAANREYLIKWKGYGERMCSWITAEDVSDPHILQRYWQKHVQLQKQEEGRIRERVAQMPSKQQRKRAATGEADQAGAPQSPAKRRRATYVRKKTG
ncbi:uncharacterized protein ATC70_007074 [Mucor velutinosus]|uniref:Reverse transcriptase n=1 Tax=Mucor velutinosus TaxID=708070 RepID=A0AAN7D3U6_9FUNG|nr:hypothetical protein ATC70_007074 [Mucor velutinosus]